MRIVTIILSFASILLLPAYSAAQSSGFQSLDFRIGKLTGSTNQDDDEFHELLWGTSYTYYFGKHSAISGGLDVIAYTFNSTFYLPITACYKYFPGSNGVREISWGKRPPVMPWIGGGGGLYLTAHYSHSTGDSDCYCYESTYTSSSSTGGGYLESSRWGVFLASGIQFPVSVHVAVETEMRYTFTQDSRFLNYTCGLVVRI